ncbi:MAG: diguanylate cyclase [Spirochaetales bacterium]|nr:diguanylate cyclase [Spirochaetales bacterium]
MERGVLNLRDRDLEEDWMIPLAGEWGFFWDSFATTATAGRYDSASAPKYIPVPQAWNEGDDPYPVFGKALYTLTVLTREDQSILGIELKNLNPNFILYANGKKIYTCGNPSIDPAQSRAANVSLVLPLVPEEGRIDLIFVMSNWHTNIPGFFRLPLLGEYETAVKVLMKEKTRESLFIGAMLLLSLYLFFSYLYNREEGAKLWLGFVILSAALYASVKGPLILMDLFPAAGGELRSKVIYLVLLLYPYFTYRQYKVQKNLKINRMIGRIDLILVVPLTLIVLLTPKGFFTRFELLFVGHALVLSLYVVFVLVRDFFRLRTLEAVLALAGDLLLFLAVLFSVLDNSFSLSNTGLAVYFFCFCFFQTILQARFAGKNSLMVKVLSERNRTLNAQKNQYENQALMDHLTRVKNRRSLDSFIKKSWDLGSFFSQGLGVIMIDIDFFKRYNDSLGHKKGDACLVMVAEALSNNLKRNQDFIARYGGEEFIVIIQGVDSLFSLFNIGEHLRKAVEDMKIPHPDSDVSSYVTISVGIEYLDAGEESPSDDLIQRADTALYLAKNRGRNRVETINSLPVTESEAMDV